MTGWELLFERTLRAWLHIRNRTAYFAKLVRIAHCDHQQRQAHDALEVTPLGGKATTYSSAGPVSAPLGCAWLYSGWYNFTTALPKMPSLRQQPGSDFRAGNSKWGVRNP